MALIDDIGIIVTFNVLLAIFFNVGINKNAESTLEILFRNPWFLVTGLLYFIVMESSNKQATLGKLFEGLVVTDLQGEKISLFRALLRNLSKILSVMVLLFGFIMPAFTKRKQALHDLIAGTIILKTTGALLPEEIECPECNEYLGLSIQERILGEYYCPTCIKKYNVLLPEEIECLECNEYLGLSIQERILGEYYCPTCNKKIKYTD